MRTLKELIRLHKFVFSVAVLITFLSVFFNLWWNKFLADVLDGLGNATALGFRNVEAMLSEIFIRGIFIIFLYTLSEYVSSYLAAYTCEMFAHEMRMGYVRYYLQSNIQTLSKLNVGEAQSAMQNELKDISYYLNENLFSFMKQFVLFVATVVFLLYQNFKLTLLSIFPVVPLIIYCYFSGKIIKGHTEQCQQSKKQINGLADILLELFPIIQVYSAYKLIDSALDERLSEWEKANVRKERVSARLLSLSGLLSFVPLLLLLGFGGFMVINGEISIGIFYIFINLSGNVSGFLQNLPGKYAGFRQFGASVGRIEQKLVLK